MGETGLAMGEKQLDQLTGTVERVVFRNEDNGWTVIELDDGQELHKAVGVLPMVSVGGNSLPAGRLGGSPEL